MHCQQLLLEGGYAAWLVCCILHTA
jgi:hypothetical protein